ncbi:MAG: flavodoxin family protein [Coriobacteriales bacterium]
MSRKILVVIGSPRKGGNTTILAEAFARGAREAGHEVEFVDAGRAKIAGCLGCEYCFKHEGVCCQQDDMQEFYPKLRWCDTLVYATPIYCFTFSAQIKAFIDRMYCGIGKPFGIADTVLLAAFEDKDPSVANYVVDTYRALTKYCRMNDAGVVTVGGVYEKGAIEGNPGLQEAYELGKSLQ